MSIRNDDTANKIRNVFEKKLREDLENQIGSVSDEVYYKARDIYIQGMDSEVSDLYRTVEESTKRQLENMQSKSKDQDKEESKE